MNSDTIPAVGDLKLQSLQTELPNCATAHMDTLSPSELLHVLHHENYSVAEAVDKAMPEIVAAVEIIAERLEMGGRLLYAGAGTSGRMGVLDASECPPTFGTPPEMVQGIIAGGDTALRNAVEGAEDSLEVGLNDLLARNLTALDVVVAIAASGRTPYAIGVLRAARQSGAYAVAVVNVTPSALSQEADITIAAVTGPEALTGSTRLKAGTAQKMVLNLLSTGAMVLLGKSYGNLMVDVKATNAKLMDRAIRIVVDATNSDRREAEKALIECDWHAKTAIVMLMSKVDPETAKSRLVAARGRVRKALDSNA